MDRSARKCKKTLAIKKVKYMKVQRVGFCQARGTVHYAVPPVAQWLKTVLL